MASARWMMCVLALTACKQAPMRPAAGSPVEPQKLVRDDFLCGNGQRLVVVLNLRARRIALDAGNGTSAELAEIAPDTDTYSNGSLTFTRHQQFAALNDNGVVTECRLTTIPR
jgi:hypothetical protein